MSTLKNINRQETLSDIFSFSLMKNMEKSVLEATSNLLNKEETLPFLVDDTTFIGIEVEVEGLDEGNFPDMRPFWAIRGDGSLRNNGMEFVSTPMRGKSLIVALKELEKVLKERYPNHDFSDRTSVHVHINVRTMLCETFINFLLLYCVFESVLYKYVFDSCGKKRDTNIFCVPLQETGHSLCLDDAIRIFEKGDNKTSLVRLSQTWKKYSGLNLIPIRSFGTTEFRHLGGISSTEKILGWINLLLSMKIYAENTSYQFLKETVLGLNTNSMYEMFTKDVFGRTSTDILKYNVKEELEKGVIYVKYIFESSKRRMRVITEDEVDKSSFKMFLEKQLDTGKLKKKQKKSFQEMTREELEKQYLSLSNLIVEQTLSINLLSSLPHTEGQRLDLEDQRNKLISTINQKERLFEMISYKYNNEKE